MKERTVELLRKALDIGLAMRAAQKEYFRRRNNDSLEEARRLEREYDAAALEAAKVVSGEPIQQDLLKVEPTAPPAPPRNWSFATGFGEHK